MIFSCAGSSSAWSWTALSEKVCISGQQLNEALEEPLDFPCQGSALRLLRNLLVDAVPLQRLAPVGVRRPPRGVVPRRRPPVAQRPLRLPPGPQLHQRMRPQAQVERPHVGPDVAQLLLPHPL